MVLVWTAICRELHANKLKAIIFINEQGIKRNIQIEEMEDFFQNHYISNLLYDNGQLQGIGISLSDLTTYNLMTNGQYKITPGIGDQQIYYRASPYIANQKAKIKSDRVAGKLKTEDKDDSNAGELTGAQKVAIATVAVGAAAAGVSKLTKVIGNQLNAKKYAELKQDLYDKLSKYHELIEELIRLKNNTNMFIEQNCNIMKYSRELECRNACTNSLKQNIMQYGVPGYLGNIQTLIQNCINNAQASNLYDLTLDDIGMSGTLRSFCDMLASRMNVVKNLHIQTENIIKGRIQERNNVMMQEQHMMQLTRQQEELVRNLDTDIETIRFNISQISTYTNFIERRNYINSLDVSTLQNQLNNILDDETRAEYYNIISDISMQISRASTECIREQQHQVDEAKEEIEERIRHLTTLISELKSGKYSGDEANNILQEVEQEFTDLELKINQDTPDIKMIYLESFNQQKKQYSRDKFEIQTGIKKANKLKQELDKANEMIYNISSFINEINDFTDNTIDLVGNSDILISINSKLTSIEYKIRSISNNIKEQDINNKVLAELNLTHESYKEAFNKSLEKVFNQYETSMKTALDDIRNCDDKKELYNLNTKQRKIQNSAYKLTNFIKKSSNITLVNKLTELENEAEQIKNEKGIR